MSKAKDNEMIEKASRVVQSLDGYIRGPEDSQHACFVMVDIYYLLKESKERLNRETALRSVMQKGYKTGRLYHCDPYEMRIDAGLIDKKIKDTGKMDVYAIFDMKYKQSILYKELQEEIDYGEIYPAKEFLNLCLSGMILPYDGCIVASDGKYRYHNLIIPRIGTEKQLKAKLADYLEKGITHILYLSK